MWFFGSKGASGFSSRSTAEEVTHGVDGTGLTAIVTGASSGIGVETARVLSLRGVHVVMAVRNTDSGAKVKEDIVKQVPGAKLDVMELDLSSMQSVRKFASEYKSTGLPLNLLINNAGIMACPFMLSKDNIELQFATNHLGHFLLTKLLLDTMKSTSRESKREGRIVNLSSEAHRFSYPEGVRFDKINDKSSSMRAYGQSKLCNVLHANELTKQLKEDGVNITANSLHPGAIMTNLGRYFNPYLAVAVGAVAKYILKSVPQGAATTCYVALNPQVAGVSGEYFQDSNIAKPLPLVKDTELAKKVWDFSTKLTDSQSGESSS
ncbi:NAD(P)-binding Rossmann-fold superfamily protein [Arabidopsis thaliana]|uniref:Isoform 2 of Short-chain dehydrogenase TIC 32, chloroplastic n=1 Tax=Arabidopsis thaliana TaxID=3702 RepID=A2RVM0-2|nr:NAD(P)-binding Rossmann-fold superfamily protein [Arabidopsis thaliana]AAM65772.1 putativepod-specific dehydrogenase SAC25 [Arabidopsis thaliana]AEE84753.1 NAD(P)-binding Rossmann-fold superfamily protein [Arabidopsis thaliana]|eukprot:NP_567681.1 NAD(P)-binding Rossmann-fold superfamily protein [Arabidopsis thaliana]